MWVLLNGTCVIVMDLTALVALMSAKAPNIRLNEIK
jgi:hypothetical protein